MRKVAVDTDPAVWAEQIGMATSTDPEERARFHDRKNNNLLALVDKLSEGDLKQLLTAQASGPGQMAKEQQALLTNAAYQNQIVTEAIMSMGMDPSPKQAGAKDYDQAAVDRVNAFRRTVRETVATLEHQNQRAATDDEVQGIVDRLTYAHVKAQKVDNWGPFNTNIPGKYAWEVTKFEDIPVAVRESIKRGIYQTPGAVATKERVLGLYRMYLAGVKPPAEGTK